MYKPIPLPAAGHQQAWLHRASGYALPLAATSLCVTFSLKYRMRIAAVCAGCVAAHVPDAVQHAFPRSSGS
jgi:hypothetical protein